MKSQSSNVLYSTSGDIRWCPRATPRVHCSPGRQDLPKALGGGLPQVRRPTGRPAQPAGGHRRVAREDGGRLPSDTVNRPSDRIAVERRYRATATSRVVIYR